MSMSKGNSKVSTESKKENLGQSLKEKIKVLDGDLKYEMWKNNKSKRAIYPYRYNKNHWDQVRRIHMKFLEAGANIIRTNTTKAFFSEMKKSTIQEYSMAKYKEFIREAVEIASNAVKEHNNNKAMKEGQWQQAMVVGSCGHFDRPPSTKRSYIKKEYGYLIKALSDCGINTFCLEKIQSREDANILLELLKELQNGTIRAFMMFKPNDVGSLNDGTDWITIAVHCYNKFPLIAVGINCIHTDEAIHWLNKFKEKQRELRKQIPLAVCTNRYTDNKEWHPFGKHESISPINWAELGIHYMGGCCGVGAEHILEIRKKLDKYNGALN